MRLCDVGIRHRKILFFLWSVSLSLWGWEMSRSRVRVIESVDRFRGGLGGVFEVSFLVSPPSAELSQEQLLI